MRVLIDHNLDWRLKHYLPGHEVKTVFEMGWADRLNGELLDQAVDGKFDVLLTSDSNMKHQQNLSSRPLAIVILRARNNQLKTHVPMMPEVIEGLLTIAAGQLLEIKERRIKPRDNFSV